MRRTKLDDIDVKILSNLQRDARLSNVQLADRIGLSPAPCLRRVRALEQAGVIRQYLTVVDQTAVNLGVTVWVQVSLDLQMEGRLDIFERAILRRPEVLECYLMTGDADYLLRVVVPDVASYEHFLRDALTRIESVAGIKSSFSIKQVKHFTEVPLLHAGADRPDRVGTGREIRSLDAKELRTRSSPRRRSPGAHRRESSSRH